MRALKNDPTPRVIIRGHALMQNLRCGNDELGVEAEIVVSRSRTGTASRRSVGSTSSGKEGRSSLLRRPPSGWPAVRMAGAA